MDLHTTLSSYHFRLGLTIGLVISVSPIKLLNAFLSLFVYATWLAHVFIPDFVSQMIFDEEYKL
jgi:hypothetical protein